MRSVSSCRRDMTHNIPRFDEDLMRCCISGMMRSFVLYYLPSFVVHIGVAYPSLYVTAKA